MLIRPVQYRDLEAVRRLYEANTTTPLFPHRGVLQPGHGIHRLFGPVKFLSFFPNPMQHLFCLHVAQLDGQIVGTVQVWPSNAAQTTWQVEHLAVVPALQEQGVGTLLLQHVFEYYSYQARNWTVEVDVHDRAALALFRENGFQRMAEQCYWRLSPQMLADVARTEIQPLNLLPASNADAALLCRLETSTMPSEVRQVYDRHPNDFYRGLATRAIDLTTRVVGQAEHVSQYIYEPQRQVAISFFDLEISRNGLQPHRARLLVHPGYTHLYPQLTGHIARILERYPPQDLHLVSADYEQKLEEYLEKTLAAEDLERRLLMSRSVWRKKPLLRIALENLQLPEMLPGFSLGKPLPEPIQRHEYDANPGTGDPPGWL